LLKRICKTRIAWHVLACRLQGEYRPDAFDRAQQPIRLEWLEQIVERCVVEGLHRVAVEGRHKHDTGIAFDALRHFQAAHAWHLNIEKGQIRLEFFDGGRSLIPIARDVHDLQFGPQQCQLLLEIQRKVRLVVGNQGARHARAVQGRESEACMPTAWGVSVKAALAP
jgi:hypothetical protein